MDKTSNIQSINFKTDMLDIGFEIKPLSVLYQKLNENSEKSHIINFYSILFITRGKGQHEIDFRCYDFKKNNIIFINKGQENRWVKYKNSDGFIILFTEEFLQKNQVIFKDLSYSYPYNSYLYKPLLIIDEKEIESFLILVNYIFKEYQLSNNEYYSEILQHLLRTFLLKIKGKEPDSVTNGNIEQKELFIQFQKMIDNKINKSRNVNDYCKWLSVSYKKLNETCKIFTQHTAKSFIDNILLIKAKQLLIDNKKSISEIAYMLSFEEPTNFTKFFKKQTNSSPKEFQKATLIV